MASRTRMRIPLSIVLKFSFVRTNESGVLCKTKVGILVQTKQGTDSSKTKRQAHHGSSRRALSSLMASNLMGNNAPRSNSVSPTGVNSAPAERAPTAKILTVTDNATTRSNRYPSTTSTTA